MTLPSGVYLGDGAYAKITEFGEIMVYTSDGVSITNTVYLERDAMQILVKYAKEHGFVPHEST